MRQRQQAVRARSRQRRSIIVLNDTDIASGVILTRRHSWAVGHFNEVDLHRYLFLVFLKIGILATSEKFS